MIGVINEPVFVSSVFPPLNNFIISFTQIHKWKLKWHWFKCAGRTRRTHSNPIYLSRDQGVIGKGSYLKLRVNISVFWVSFQIILLLFLFHPEWKWVHLRLNGDFCSSLDISGVTVVNDLQGGRVCVFLNALSRTGWPFAQSGKSSVTLWNWMRVESKGGSKIVMGLASLMPGRVELGWYWAGMPQDSHIYCENNCKYCEYCKYLWFELFPALWSSSRSRNWRVNV